MVNYHVLIYKEKYKAKTKTQNPRSKQTYLHSYPDLWWLVLLLATIPHGLICILSYCNGCSTILFFIEL